MSLYLIDKFDFKYILIGRINQDNLELCQFHLIISYLKTKILNYLKQKFLAPFKQQVDKLTTQQCQAYL